MTSEWLKVMLGEVARKKAEAEQARIEAEGRGDEPLRGDGQPRSDQPLSDDGGRAPNTDAAPDPAPGVARRAR